MKKLTFILVAAGIFVTGTAFSQANNTQLGNQALRQNTTGYRNVAVGDSALNANTGGYGNSAMGYKALRSNTTGNFNTALGGFTLTKVNASQNTAIGYKSQESATGTNNISVGYQSYQTGKGSQNIAIGSKAMQNAAFGGYNVSVGYTSMPSVSGGDNTGLGSYVFSVLTSGSDNVAVGYRAGSSLTTGMRNIFLGGYTAASGNASYNTVIGYSSGAPANSSGNIVIGNGVTLPAGSSDALNIGNVLYGTGLKKPATNIHAGGRIGINVANPEATLQVNAEGNPESYEGDPGNGFMIKGNDHVMYMGVRSDAHVSYIQSVDYGTDVSPLLLNARGGSVGINTMTPDYPLDVNGTIRAKEVKVNLNEGADFVFEDDYRLRPLQEVQSFIEANKHLPDIAPASEMTSGDGVDMGEMQVKLLQKIEELTLYIIAQDEKIERLEKKVQGL